MNQNHKEFENKSVVVTGAAAGMGSKITERFLEQGAIVVAVDLNENALIDLKEGIKQKYGNEAAKRLICYHGDVSKQNVNETMIDKAIAQTGTIDILVNNAGIAGHSETIIDTTNDDWDRIIDVNLKGPMFAIRAAVAKMISQPQVGNIVTIASVAGIKGCRSSVAYGVAKHGLVGLCEHTAYAYMHI